MYDLIVRERCGDDKPANQSSQAAKSILINLMQFSITNDNTCPPFPIKPECEYNTMQSK